MAAFEDIGHVREPLFVARQLYSEKRGSKRNICLALTHPILVSADGVIIPMDARERVWHDFILPALTPADALALSTLERVVGTGPITTTDVGELAEIVLARAINPFGKTKPWVSDADLERDFPPYKGTPIDRLFKNVRVLPVEQQSAVVAAVEVQFKVDDRYVFAKIANVPVVDHSQAVLGGKKRVRGGAAVTTTTLHASLSTIAAVPELQTAVMKALEAIHARIWRASTDLKARHGYEYHTLGPLGSEMTQETFLPMEVTAGTNYIPCDVAHAFRADMFPHNALGASPMPDVRAVIINDMIKDMTAANLSLDGAAVRRVITITPLQRRQQQQQLSVGPAVPPAAVVATPATIPATVTEASADAMDAPMQRVKEIESGLRAVALASSAAAAALLVASSSASAAVPVSAPLGVPAVSRDAVSLLEPRRLPLRDAMLKLHAHATRLGITLADDVRRSLSRAASTVQESLTASVSLVDKTAALAAFASGVVACVEITEAKYAIVAPRRSGGRGALRGTITLLEWLADVAL